MAGSTVSIKREVLEDLATYVFTKRDIEKPKQKKKKKTCQAVTSKGCGLSRPQPNFVCIRVVQPILYSPSLTAAS